MNDIFTTTTIDRSRKALAAVDRAMDRAPARVRAVEVILKEATAVLCLGVGKSKIVADMTASLLRSVGVPAVSVHATDVVHGDAAYGMRQGRRVMIGFSHSGKTEEVKAALRSGDDLGYFTVAITSDQHDDIGAVASTWLNYAVPVDGSKHGTIPTASVTAQLAYANEIVCRIADKTQVEALHAGHRAGALGETYDERTKTDD